MAFFSFTSSHISFQPAVSGLFALLRHFEGISCFRELKPRAELLVATHATFSQLSFMFSEFLQLESFHFQVSYFILRAIFHFIVTVRWGFLQLSSGKAVVGWHFDRADYAFAEFLPQASQMRLLQSRDTENTLSLQASLLSAICISASISLQRIL